MWQDLKYDNVCFKPPTVYPTVFSPWNFFLSPRSLSCTWYYTSLKSIGLKSVRQFSCSVESDSATPWTTALQASLSITNSRSSPKLMSIELVMPSNHLILCRPLLLRLQSIPASGSFQMSQLFASGGQSIGVSASTSVLPMNTQDSFPFRMDWLDLLAVLIIIHFHILRDLFGNSLAETLK